MLPNGASMTSAILSVYRKGHFDMWWTYQWGTGGYVKPQSILESWDENGESASAQNSILWNVETGDALSEVTMSGNGWYHFDVTNLLNELDYQGVLLTAKAFDIPTPGKSGMLSKLVSSESGDVTNRPKLTLTWEGVGILKEKSNQYTEKVTFEGGILSLEGHSTAPGILQIMSVQGRILHEVPLSPSIKEYLIPAYLSSTAIIVVVKREFTTYSQVVHIP